MPPALHTPSPPRHRQSLPNLLSPPTSPPPPPGGECSQKRFPRKQMVPRKSMTLNACTACRKRRTKVCASFDNQLSHHRNLSPLIHLLFSTVRWPISMQHLLSRWWSPSRYHVYVRIRVDRPGRQEGFAAGKRRAPSTKRPLGPDPRRPPIRLPRLRYPSVVERSGKSGHHRPDREFAVTGGIFGRFPVGRKLRIGRVVVGGDVVKKWWGALATTWGECRGLPAESEHRRSRLERNPVSLDGSPMRPATGQASLCPLLDLDLSRFSLLQHGAIYRTLRDR